MSAIIGGMVRHAMTTAGGALALSGTCTVDTTQTAIGAIVGGAGFLWSMWNKTAA